MRAVILFLAVLMLLSPNTAQADFKKGMSAYERGDYATALSEFQISAEQGNTEAQMMLGILYAEGEGVLQNYVEAHKWFNLSASRGNAQAKKARDKVAEKMTPEQISAAQRLAAEWRLATATKEMASPPAKPAVVQPEPAISLSREEKREIQNILADLGYDPGLADGLIGARTRTAIRSYQTDAGLPVDGKVSKVVLERLREDHRSFRPVAEGGEKPEDLDALVDRLKGLTTEAERRGAAERWVLDELWGLVRQYDWPWKRKIVEDNFADGDYTAHPSWMVVTGQFFVDEQMGLRTTVRKAEPQEEKREEKPEDIAVELLQSFLKRGTDEGDKATGPAEEAYAEIHIAAGISNAFAITITVVSQIQSGRLEFGPYAGSNRDTGYRLAYTPGAASGLELLGVSAYRSTVVDLYQKPLNLEDGRSHTLLWTRNDNGEMSVSLDGNEILQVTDRRFNETFGGFVLVNRGGDYGIQHVNILGSKAGR
jgi:hypothetical protein